MHQKRVRPAHIGHLDISISKSQCLLQLICWHEGANRIFVDTLSKLELLHLLEQVLELLVLIEVVRQVSG